MRKPPAREKRFRYCSTPKRKDVGKPKTKILFQLPIEVKEKAQVLAWEQ